MRRGKKIFLLLTVFVSVRSQAQRNSSIIKGIGVFGAGTASANYYTNTEAAKKLDTPYVFNRFYPPSHISKELLNWGAGVFIELSRRDRIRWQTELEYTHKGAQEKELLNIFTGERASNWQKNKYTYIQWNNYAKFYFPIGYRSHYYIMPGIRLEYLLQKSTPVFSSVSSRFPKYWFSGDIGLGYEFPVYKRFSAFVEFHYNPDVISHKHDNTKVRNRTFELRMGAVMRKKKRSIDDCNAPRYNGPEY